MTPFMSMQSLHLFVSVPTLVIINENDYHSHKKITATGILRLRLVRLSMIKVLEVTIYLRLWRDFHQKPLTGVRFFALGIFSECRETQRLIPGRLGFSVVAISSRCSRSAWQRVPPVPGSPGLDSLAQSAATPARQLQDPRQCCGLSAPEAQATTSCKIAPAA